MIRLSVFSLALAASLVMARASAHAEAKEISCSILEIKGTNGDGGIDAKLKPLAKKLKKPPFSAWKSFKLEAKHDKTLSLMKSEQVSLKLGGKVSLLYRQHTKPEGKSDRFSLDLALDSKSGKRALDTKIVVDKGDYFVIAAASNQDSSDLLALTCQK